MTAQWPWMRNLTLGFRFERNMWISRWPDFSKWMDQIFCYWLTLQWFLSESILEASISRCSKIWLWRQSTTVHPPDSRGFVGRGVEILKQKGRVSPIHEQLASSCIQYSVAVSFIKKSFEQKSCFEVHSSGISHSVLINANEAGWKKNHHETTTCLSCSIEL